MSFLSSFYFSLQLWRDCYIENSSFRAVSHVGRGDLTVGPLLLLLLLRIFDDLKRRSVMQCSAVTFRNSKGILFQRFPPLELVVGTGTCRLISPCIDRHLTCICACAAVDSAPFCAKWSIQFWFLAEKTDFLEIPLYTTNFSSSGTLSNSG